MQTIADGNRVALPTPQWVRASSKGVEFWSGLSRSKLYQLANSGQIESVSLRERGQKKGTRLFKLSSIFDLYERKARGGKRGKK